MAELNVLRYAYLFLRARLTAIHDDERGISTLETVLLVGGLAAIALAAIVVIGNAVTGAGDKIPTGPAAP